MEDKQRGGTKGQQQSRKTAREEKETISTSSSRPCRCGCDFRKAVSARLQPISDHACCADLNRNEGSTGEEKHRQESQSNERRRKRRRTIQSSNE